MMSSREVRDGLRASLTAAIKTRDDVAVSALRSALSAIANAEAVGADSGGMRLPRLGIGVTDMPRRELSTGDVIAIIHAEVAERTSAATELRRLGRAEAADRAEAEAAVLMSYVGGET